MEASSIRDRRAALRYLFSVAAKCFDPESATFADALLSNIGLEGCCAEGLLLLQVGQKRLLTIDWRGQRLQVEAEVVWRDAQGRAGFRFLSVGKESADLLSELCSTLQLQPAIEPPSEAA